MEKYRYFKVFLTDIDKKTKSTSFISSSPGGKSQEEAIQYCKDKFVDWRVEVHPVGKPINQPKKPTAHLYSKARSKSAGAKHV